MKHLIYLLFSFLSVQSYASSLPPENIELSNEDAYCLGISATGNTSDFITVSFPSHIKSNWIPVSTLIVYSINEEPIFSSSTNFDKPSLKYPFVILNFNKQQKGIDASISFLYKNINPKLGQNSLRYYSIKSAGKLAKVLPDSCGA